MTENEFSKLVQVLSNDYRKCSYSLVECFVTGAADFKFHELRIKMDVIEEYLRRLIKEFCSEKGCSIKCEISTIEENFGDDEYEIMVKYPIIRVVRFYDE